MDYNIFSQKKRLIKGLSSENVVYQETNCAGSFPYVLHKKKSATSSAYLTIKEGYLTIIPDSTAERLINQLPFGCGCVDIIENHTGDGFYISFRDKRVLVSEYLWVPDIN